MGASGQRLLGSGGVAIASAMQIPNSDIHLLPLLSIAHTRHCRGFDLSKPATWAHLNGSIHKVPLNLGIDTWWHNLIPKGASK